MISSLLCLLLLQKVPPISVPDAVRLEVASIERAIDVRLSPFVFQSCRRDSRGVVTYSGGPHLIKVYGKTGAITTYVNLSAQSQRMRGLAGKTLSRDRGFWERRAKLIANKLWPSLKLEPFDFVMYGTEGTAPGRYSSQNRLVSVSLRQAKPEIVVDFTFDEVYGKVELLMVKSRDLGIIPRIGS